MEAPVDSDPCGRVECKPLEISEGALFPGNGSGPCRRERAGEEDSGRRN